MFTRNDYLILTSILSEHDENKGFISLAGTTKREVVEKTNLSFSKVSSTLNLLESKEYIMKGLKDGSANTYIITEKGMNAIANLGGLATKQEKKRKVKEMTDDE